MKKNLLLIPILLLLSVGAMAQVRYIVVEDTVDAMIANNNPKGVFRTILVKKGPNDLGTLFTATNTVTSTNTTTRIYSGVSGWSWEKVDIGADGGSANWTADGSTNSTLPGTASVYSLIVSNGITTGSGTNGMVSIADTNGTHIASIKASTAMTDNLNIVLPASGFTDLLKAEHDGGTNLYLVPASAPTDYLTTATAQTVLTNYFEFALGDETTAITTGTKVTWRAPFAFIVKGVRASVTTASSSGNPEFDIKENGVSIFSTTLTIDASEKTSTTAATAAVVSDTAIADDAEITFPVITAGTGTTGPKVKLYYVKP